MIDEMEFHQKWLYQPHIQELYHMEGKLVDSTSCEYRFAIDNEWLVGHVSIPGV